MITESKVLQRYTITQPGQERLSFQTETGFRSFLYFHIHEVSLEAGEPDEVLYVHHARYLIRLCGKNLRPLYLSLLVEEILEIPKIEKHVGDNESYVSYIEIMENLEHLKDRIQQTT